MLKLNHLARPAGRSFILTPNFQYLRHQIYPTNIKVSMQEKSTAHHSLSSRSPSTSPISSSSTITNKNKARGIYAMDPKAPSQPPLDQVYNTQGNPADQTPQEKSTSSSNASSNSASLVDARQKGDIPVPSTHQESATPSSLGYGVRDASKDDENVTPPYSYLFSIWSSPH